MTNPAPSRRDYAAMPIRDLKALLLLRGVDPSACVEKRDLVSLCRRLDETDYDEEARRVFARMGLEPAARSRWAPLDCVWRERAGAASDGAGGGGDGGGGRVYVGNYVAASTKRILDDHSIRYVVNCQDATSRNYFEDDRETTYFRFPVARLRPHQSLSGASDGSVLEQFLPAFSFIDSSVSSGGNVLVHCLAGAHRAGTMGVAYLMYKSGMGVDEALRTAKAARPVINPFGNLLELLRGLERDMELHRRRKEEAVASAAFMSVEEMSNEEGGRERHVGSRMAEC